MDGDRPITSRSEDRLGFAQVAEKLAEVLVAEAASHGIVFGIEGEWGSGKSTLINLTVEALTAYGPSAPEVVRFSPWLVGNREELLQSLFTELAEAVRKIDPLDSAVAAENQKLAWWQKIQRKVTPSAKWRKITKDRLKRSVSASLGFFGAQAGRLGKVVKLGEYAAIPYAGPTGDALGRLGESAREFAKGASLSKRKASLDQDLRTLSRRIAIFIDDLDRLEPSEITELLRLVRAVADFPNVIYVLSYDPKVLGKTLNNAVQIDDGAAFLEKIVQVSFKVPHPEAFDLRQWFQAEAAKIFPDELMTGEEAHRDVLQRFEKAVDTQGGRYLRTPRDVVRALNALRLHAIPVRRQVDIADMIWLQLIRIGKPELYEWIEQYLIEMAAVANGARIERERIPEIERKLLELLAPHEEGLNLAVINFEQVVPGIRIGARFGNRGDNSRIFQNLTPDALAVFVRHRRLGSPQHYRLYFAFAEPSGALKDEEVQVFLSLLDNDPEQARERFAQFASTARPQGGVMAEVLIDRLIAWIDRIQPAVVPRIFGAFAFALDNVARQTRRADFGEHRAWNLAARAVTLFMRMHGVDRAACLRELFSEGRSLGWLTSILRDEIFAHGLYGDRVEPEDQRLLTQQEFTWTLDTMLHRYRSEDPEVLLNVPNLLSLLYGWLQGGGEDQVREWVAARIETDEGLLALLSRLRGYANASDIGEYFPLRRRDLDHFMDFDNAEIRVNAIRSNLQATEHQRRLAEELATAIEQGRRN